MAARRLTLEDLVGQLTEKPDESVKTALEAAETISKVDFVYELAKVTDAKIPSWRARPLAPDEYHVFVAAAAGDAKWASGIVAALRESDLKVSTDMAEAHRCRAFVVVLSEETSRDPAIVRVATSAAERYNR
jgi:hypothetical protein